MEKGDLRQSINSLQSLSKLSMIPSHILPAHDEECKEIFHNIYKFSNIGEVSEYAADVQAEGYAIDELINGFYKEIKNLENEQVQSILLEAIGKCE